MITLNARAILFDMDGTIVDSTAVVEHVWGRFADKHGIPLDTILGDSHGIKAIDTIRKYGPADIDADTEAEELAAYEIDLLDGIVEIPGAAAFVSALDDAQFALVTSAPRSLAVVRLNHCDIPVPRVIVAAEDVTRGKPDAQPYLRAAQQLGIDAADCVVFEDAPAGISAGLAAGMRVVVVGGVSDVVADELPRIADYSSSAIQQADGGGFVITLA
ncbi:MAG: HAD-IA family hydrolase [Microbacteriaceae bacterium]